MVDGPLDGSEDGFTDGLLVGVIDGLLVGCFDGPLDGSEDGFTDGLLVNVELGQFPPDAPCLISTLPLKFSGTDSSAPLFNASLISLVKVQVPIIVKATTVSDDSTCDGETEGLTLGLSVSCANILVVYADASIMIITALTFVIFILFHCLIR